MAINVLGISAKLLVGLATLLVSFAVTLWSLDLWDRQDQIIQTVVLKNSVRVTISDPIPLDPRKARVKDGFALANTSFVPKDPLSTVAVHIRTYFRSEQLSTAVVAVFRDGTDEPIRSFTMKPSSKHATEEMIALFDFSALGNEKIELNFRIGPGDSGSVRLNGLPGSAGLESRIVIREVKAANVR